MALVMARAAPLVVTATATQLAVVVTTVTAMEAVVVVPPLPLLLPDPGGE